MGSNQIVDDVKSKSVRELIDYNLKIRGQGAFEIIARFRNSLVVRALRLNNGNRHKTARMLQIHYKTLLNWIRELGE
jgi:DNA-binding NtrC family response regulator